jgi:hypothetical protein
LPDEKKQKTKSGIASNHVFYRCGSLVSTTRSFTELHAAKFPDLNAIKKKDFIALSIILILQYGPLIIAANTVQGFSQEMVF